MKIAIRFTALLMALASAVLAYSDQIKPIADMNPKLAHAWMFFSIGAGIISKGGLSLLGMFTKWQAEDSSPSITTKTPSIIAGIISLSIFGSGCAWYDSLSVQRKNQIDSTGSFVAQKVVSTFVNAILPAAINQADSADKIDIAQGLAYGLRTNEGSILTGDDIKSITAIWTPDKPHWQQFGNDISIIYDQAAPSIAAVIQKGGDATPEEMALAVSQSAHVVEQIALGIDMATK